MENEDFKGGLGGGGCGGKGIGGGWEGEVRQIFSFTWDLREDSGSGGRAREREREADLNEWELKIF